MRIKLKVDSPILGDYLKFLFPPGEDGALKVSSVPAIGKLLIAHCRESGYPVHEPEGDRIFSLDLPLLPSTQSLCYKFIYYSVSDMAALNLALKAYFDLDFAGYYRRGEKLGFQKKDIVEAFILSRGLVSKDCFDALHKRVYRAEQRSMATMTDRLMRKAYYIDESINTKGLI